MKRNSKWMPTTVLLVTLSVATVQLEPAAFGQNADDGLIAKVDASRSAGQGAPLPRQEPVAAAPRKGKRWKLIVTVAAVAAGVAVTALTRGSSGGPTITFGNPSVGPTQ
jgi:hypothetical protein